MYKHKFIRSFTAGMLLVIFAFSVTPTIFFHNWLANHKDSVRKLPSDNRDHVTKRIFNCQCDNIVAESPFTEPAAVIAVPVVKPLSSQKCDKAIHFPFAPYIFHALRGPPVA